MGVGIIIWWCVYMHVMMIFRTVNVGKLRCYFIVFVLFKTSLAQPPKLRSSEKRRSISSNFIWRHTLGDFSLTPYFRTGWSTLVSTLLAGSSYSNTMLLLKAETPAEPRGRGDGGGWPGPRSTRTCLYGCASERTHINQAITSSPGRLIGWRRRQGRGNAKNRRDGPFWLNEPVRHQVEDPPLPRSWLEEKGT